MARKKIKEKKLDEIFSLYVRTKHNWTCERCGTRIEPPTNQIQCSHFHSRTLRSVRFDEDNADCLCAKCHWFFEQRKTTDYADWKVQKMGKEKFEALKKRAYLSSNLKVGGMSEEEKQEIIEKYKVV